MGSQIDETQGNRPSVPDEDFDEAWYLRKYPDVAAAVARGGWKSGYEHYSHTGRECGRLGSPLQEAAAQSKPSRKDTNRPQIMDAGPTTELFDADFYSRAYPLAAEEVRRGNASDYRQHYHRSEVGDRQSQRCGVAGIHCWFSTLWNQHFDRFHACCGLQRLCRRKSAWIEPDDWAEGRLVFSRE
jgi:hypothetical protein